MVGVSLADKVASPLAGHAAPHLLGFELRLFRFEHLSRDSTNGILGAYQHLPELTHEDACIAREKSGEVHLHLIGIHIFILQLVGRARHDEDFVWATGTVIETSHRHRAHLVDSKINHHLVLKAEQFRDALRDPGRDDLKITL